MQIPGVLSTFWRMPLAGLAESCGGEGGVNADLSGSWGRLSKRCFDIKPLRFPNFGL